jgi:hypothetical protein
MIVTTGVNDDNMCHCVMYNCSMCIANVLTVAVRCCACRNRSDRRLALPASLLCDVVLSVACRFRLRGLVDVVVVCCCLSDAMIKTNMATMCISIFGLFLLCS